MERPSPAHQTPTVPPGEAKNEPAWALDPSRRPAKTPSAESADEDEPDEEAPRLVCRRCRTEIAREDAVFSVAAGGAVQVFPNPAGWMRKILTVRRAENLHLAGPATLDFTWFAGYAWSIATCAGCGAHLGWAYDTTQGQAPARFYGLLVDALERG